jgi:hypothetical protein
LTKEEKNNNKQASATKYISAIQIGKNGHLQQKMIENYSMVHTTNKKSNKETFLWRPMCQAENKKNLWVMLN